MSAPARLARGVARQAPAAAAALLVGSGAALVLAGAASGRIGLAAAGAAAGGAGALLVLAAGWVDGLALLALALPMPALYATESLRVGTAVVATALVLVGWALHRAPDPRPLLLAGLPRRSVAALFTAVLIAAVLARHPVPAARELVNVTAFLALLVAATDGLSGRPARRRRVALAVAAAVGLAGAAAVPEALGILPVRFPLEGGGLARAAGGFGWPNELAMFLAVGLPFTVYAARTAPTPGQRMLGWAALVAAGAGLLVTFSRGSWLTVLVAPGVFLLLGEGRRTARIWGAALLLAALVDVATGGAIRDRAAAALLDTSAAQRLALMGAGLLMFLERPLIGIGPGGFGDELETVGLQVSGLWDFVGSAHNAYVHMAAEAGLLGLAAFLAFLGAAAWILLKRAREAKPGPGVRDGPGHSQDPGERALRRTLLWAFASALLVGMFEWTLAHGVAQLIVLTVALGVAIPPTEAP